MNTGLGFTELLVIGVLILVFFGSKELPLFLRELGRISAKLKRYSDKIKRELDEITLSLEPTSPPFEEQKEKKKELRKIYLSKRKNLSEEERYEKSKKIIECLMSLEVYKKATMIMMYAEMGAEVITTPFIKNMLTNGKRIVLPYCIENSNELGIAEIHNIDTDLIVGPKNVREPSKELRKVFFKSDLQLVVCPGVAFDIYGGRLGRGAGCYDSFSCSLLHCICCNKPFS
ncbi:MAG: 5-formyltetrahydrofolate cyclo-ligase [Chitinispirillaceae bacterium]|nr:5-formyltetrahydrofolate cyclo-ligase [Chitinispirillaceae bacterium]